ncbi:TMEM43 family protein [Azospirillum halopraeferens]|uniref:TMEM43 family protein n=1 Tax=Azospirillum halopraeferens TaxID=34010 RepID=UPI000405C976|nr:TMEM43 family protein [Azospirillum halopraeferens]
MADNGTVTGSGGTAADIHVETTRTGWLGRAGDSVVGALIGLALFAGSLVLLAWNEGRAVDAMMALEAGAGLVTTVAADRVDPANEGRLVHVAGPVTVSGSPADPVFGVRPGTALRLERRVEMYQWRETAETRTETSVGGTETRTTTYRYTREWSDRSIDSGAFRQPEGHGNPPMLHRSTTLDAQNARVGAFALTPGQIRAVDATEPLLPDADAALPPGFRREGEYLYRGESQEAPRVGDLRVHFLVAPADTLSVVAAQSGAGLAPYAGARGHTIELVRPGVLSAEAMFARAMEEEALLTWLLRAGGFVLMLVAVLLVTGPVAWLASVLPWFRPLVDGARFALALVVALPLTLATIALAWLAHRPLLAAGLLAAAVIAAVAARRLAPSRRQPGVRPA